MFFSAKAFAETSILMCRADGEGWKSTIWVGENGTAKFILKKDKKRYECALKIKTFAFRSHAIIPIIDFEFLRGACVPDLTEAENKRFLDFITLLIKKDSPKVQNNILQWLRFKQTTQCILTKYDGVALKRNAEKWQNGVWGKSKK